MMAKQEAAKASGEKNAAEGKKFLADNKTKEGVKTTASGVQYKVLKEGSGPVPKATDTVKVNYRGTTIDGTEFDSSYKRGQPASFPVNRVIKGWTEALQLMNGSKHQPSSPRSSLTRAAQVPTSGQMRRCSLMWSCSKSSRKAQRPRRKPRRAVPRVNRVLQFRQRPGQASCPAAATPRRRSHSSVAASCPRRAQAFRAAPTNPGDR
jgi:hypothetical protein